MPKNSTSSQEMLVMLRKVHAHVVSEVMAHCEDSSFDELCGEPRSVAGDTAYAIDHVAEKAMLQALDSLIAVRWPVVVVGEGVPSGQVVLPADASEVDCHWRIIIDPIDGTRGFMFQKRPGWILTAAASNRGDVTSLADIEVALQTELPLLKQYLFDSFWTIRGQGVQAERSNLLTGARESFLPRPSSATTLVHGFGTVCSFFAGGRDQLGRIADELSHRLLSGSEPSEARIFDDQYAATGGQIAGLLTGQDRFVVDLRPLLFETLSKRGAPLGHCCHPYDICTKLIAEEAGVQICSPTGDELNSPLNTKANVAWVGYANRELRNAVEPVLAEVLDDILGQSIT
jgi:hypothetical protein